MSRLKQTCNQDCKLKCCLSCTFCNRAVGKQRHKTQSEPNRNKVCETCLLCKSLSLCSNCSKCPSCCTKSTCGGPTAKVLAGLALPGCKQKSSFNSSGRVHPTLQRETSPDKVTGNYQWIRKSGQKQAHKGLYEHQAVGQSQTSQICVPGPGSASLESGCSKRSLARSGCLCFSPGGSPREGGLQVDGSMIQQGHSHCTRVAQHAMVLGSGQHVSTDSPKSTESREPIDSTLQPVSSQGPSQSESACMAPTAFAIQQAGFSEEVATRIEAPQRRSTRAIYESKWSVFVRWCEEHKVDFRSPSIKQIADFLLYLFQEKHLQPSTIDGYRTAISDKLGNGRVNIGKDENLTRLLDSFHRDKPKGRRGVPSWNLSLVLHQLTKPPFEPLRKASLKHLTFKTVFLLALGSGKRRSEIHAWVHRNIRHQEDWSKVSLYPSPSFISKNHLAKEGPGCVAPVIIPALAPTLDKSLKEDRTLCPVRSLRYYLDKTKDLRSDKELVFVCFRKSFKKDIVPATVSSWIKQTIGLCYQLSDEQSQNLHQVRAHDVWAFAASKLKLN